MQQHRALSDERYRILTLMSPDAISIADDTGRILDCNEQFALLHGYASASELIGRNGMELTEPKEFERLQQWVGTAFANGEVVVRGVPVKVLRRDGSMRVTEYSVGRIGWPESPSGVAYISSIRDITERTMLMTHLEAREARLEHDVEQRTADLHAEVAERVRLEDALRQRVLELSSLQALGQAVSFAHPLEETVDVYLQRLIVLGHVMAAHLFLLNEHGLQLAGMRTDEHDPSARPIDPAAAECASWLAVQKGQPVSLGHETLWCGQADSMSASPGLVAAFPLYTADSIVGTLVVSAANEDASACPLPFLEMAADLIAGRLHNALLHQEVQERAAGLEEAVAERTRELQTERDRTQAILETLGESVVVADQEGTVLFANLATVGLTGCLRDEIIGQPIWSRWTPQALAQTWPEAQRAVLSGQAWQGEVTGSRRDGALYTAGLTGTPLYDLSAATPIGSVWVQRDITLLKEAERLKDQFVSNVSHELRTPISIIALTCDNLETFRSRLSEDERWQMFQEIHDQAHRLARLAEDILRISQIDNGVPTAKRCVDLAEILRDEVEGQQLVAQKRRHQLCVDAGAGVYVMGNEIQLRQVIRNLLDNAIKYTPSGGQISCRCALETEDPASSGQLRAASGKSWAVMEVQDTGIGIAPSELPLIFERFYRVGTELDVAGTGLGLYIAQELVAEHGGWIGVTSTPGVGSTFAVHLPSCEQEINAPRLCQPEGAGDGA